MELEKWNVFEWLEKAGMSQYAESFVDNGYDTPDLCGKLENDDLTAIGVTNKNHRSILFKKARELLNLVNSSEEATDAPNEQPTKPLSPLVINTTPSPTLPTSPSNVGQGDYSEPWHNSYTGRGLGGGGGPGVIKIRKTNSGEKPPLPPPNKNKKKQPPPSPIATDLPTFKREGPDTGLTKLQLQLKIREELRAEGVVLSEEPYVNQEGQMCEEPLSELTERYSTKLKLQPLDIYDALRVIWNNENSFVTPLTPQQDHTHSHPVTLKGSSTENYDEPFDTAAGASPLLTPDSVKHSPKEGSPKGTKSHTLPPTANSGNYDEPFDSVIKPPTAFEDVAKARIEAQSKTLPSPKHKLAAEEREKKKSGERESSPKHSGFSKLFKRRENRRSHSIKDFDSSQREDKKSSKKGAKISFPSRSKDGLSAAKVKKGQNGASPRQSKHMDSSSDADDSPLPTKRHNGVKFKKVVTPPTMKRNEHPDIFVSSSSSADSTPETVRRLRAIRSRGLSGPGSDLEISFRRVSDDEGHKPWMVLSRSFDNLNDINRGGGGGETIEKKKEGGNIFSRLFKGRTLHAPSRKKTKNKSKKKSSNRSSLADEATSPQGGESSLANSISMPEIAAVASEKKKKKKRKMFTSSSHTPPEQLSDVEAKPSTESSPQHLSVPSTTMISIPKPKPLARTPTPNNDIIGQSLMGGSCPIQPTFLNRRECPLDPPKTPSSGGSKNQSPRSSGSDIATNESSSPKSCGRKPIPPPKPLLKPYKSSSLDDGSVESQKSFTLPLNKTGRVSSTGSRSPPKPMKQVSVPNDAHTPSSNPQAALSSGKTMEGDVRKSPPKPRRNFVTKTDSLRESTTPHSGTTETPPTSDSKPAGVSDTGKGASSRSTPPTARQRPPPKPARSIKRKPVRDRVTCEGQGSAEQAKSRDEQGQSATPVSDSGRKMASKELTPPPSKDGISGEGEGPPKPIRRIKTPKVVDSSSPQGDEREKKNTSFNSEQFRSGSNEMIKPAVSRTLNVSTPSPTSTSPTTNEGANSFAEAAAMMHNVTPTTAELSRSIIDSRDRFESSGSTGSRPGTKPKPMPKPRGLQASARTMSGGSTPARPVRPAKPARTSVRIPSPEHS